MPSQRAIVTAYDHKLQPNPTGSGLRPPPPEHTRLEQWDNDGKPYLAEYVGSGKLKGKSALVSGGASGIGRSIAVMFAREGADVSIIYLPNQEKDAEDVKKSVEEAGRRCLLLPGNLRVRKFCEESVEKHVTAFGGLNVLVNNAAQQGHSEDFSQLDLDFAETTFQTNVLAAFAITKYAIPHLKRGSSIMSSVSIGAYCGELMAEKVDYAATKGALVSFTRALAAQLAPKGIRVNAVAPGPISTPIHANTRNVPNEVLDNLAFDTPLHGRMGQPAELGPSYVFLASADSNYMTRQTVHVSAGMWTGS